MNAYASQYYIENCNSAELVELAFDAQRNLTMMIETQDTNGATEADWEAVKAYKTAIKTELVRRTS